MYLCWTCHLSFVSVAPHFSWYASDSLLLESTLLAMFVAPAGPRPGLGTPPSTGMLLLYGWLLFRLMLETGMSKILSGDPTWRSLRAMEFFFETSPFPTWIAWIAHDYRIVEIDVDAKSWLASRQLHELGLSGEGVLVLGVVRAGGGYVGAPDGALRLGAGDRLIVYRRAHRLQELSTRTAGDQAAHRAASAEHERDIVAQAGLG